MVTPPHTKEDLGLTPLEARSVGVPCIASRDGGVQETAGKHSLLCKPGDAESPFGMPQTGNANEPLGI